MDKKRSHALFISSTPKPKTQDNLSMLNDLFQNSRISPIVQPPKELPKAGPSHACRDSTVHKISTARPLVTRKRKKPVPVPDKETASNQVLKELQQVKAPSVLSYSFNRFNLHPEPIILSSDEEEVANVPARTKDELGKKTSRSKASTATTSERGTVNGPKDKGVVNKETRNSKKQQDVVLLQCTTEEEVSPAKKRLAEERVNLKEKHVSTDFDEDDIFSNTKQNLLLTKEPERTKKVVEDKSRKPKVQEPVCALDNKTVKVLNEKKKTVKNSHAVTSSSEEEENLFSGLKRTVTRKRSNPTVIDKENEQKQNSIKLRSRKKKSDEVEGEHKTASEAVRNSPDLKSEKHRPLGDGVFYFSDTVFRRNTRSGGIVAPSLETDTVKCGFIELMKNESFKGTIAEVTYLILEGSVEASLSGKSGTLVNGDVLHFNNFDEGVKFKCSSVKARLYYTRQK